jgi:hypothetical protein
MEPVYDRGVLVPPPRGYCACYCGMRHNEETFKVMYGTVYWLKHGKYPDPQAHVSKFLTILTDKRFDVT